MAIVVETDRLIYDGSSSVPHGRCDVKENVLVTGYRGYIGHNFSRLLDSFPYDRKVGCWLGHDKSESCRAFRQWEDLLLAVRAGEFDCIVHLAGNRDSQSTDLSIFEMNTGLTKDLADAIYLSGKDSTKLIFASSCLARDPMSPYAWSKRLAEDYLFAKIPEQAYALRFFNVYGGKNDDKSFIARLINGQVHHIFDNYVRDFIHINDVCRAIGLVMGVNGLVPGDPEVKPGIYDVGSCTGYSAVKLAQLTGRSDLPLVVADKHKYVKYPSANEVVACRENLLPGYMDYHSVSHEIKGWLHRKKEREYACEKAKEELDRQDKRCRHCNRCGSYGGYQWLCSECEPRGGYVTGEMMRKRQERKQFLDELEKELSARIEEVMNRIIC